MNKLRMMCGGLLLLGAVPGLALAKDVSVRTTSELAGAIVAATAGDVIILEDGTYDSTGFSCQASGLEDQPITVRARNPLQAKVRMNALEGFKVSGANWHFEDLDVTGVCAVDSSCEHAFHVQGEASGFWLRRSRVTDFNAQLKVNSAQVAGVWKTPHKGLIEGNELFDTRARNTSNPTTKLNIDTGDDWVLRANYLHDFQKGGGDTVSYGAFLKSGGKRGVVERNLVVCTTKTPPHMGGVRIGLSFGGGGTAPQFCAPAFNAAVPCDVEHEDGVLRNNLIIGCSDVGIYLNRAKNTQVLHNTLIATLGVDFRFATTSGQAAGNLLAGRIRNRDAATGVFAGNLENVTAQDFAGWYVDPLGADLRKKGDLTALLDKGTVPPGVSEDYCARARGNLPIELGALEHSLGDCLTTRPPLSDAPPVGGGPDGGSAGGGQNPVDGGAAVGCGCDMTSRSAPWAQVVLLSLLVARLTRRRQRKPKLALPSNPDCLTT